MLIEKEVGLVVIGGGPAGLAAAIAAREAGLDDILILERDSKPGGILKQCVHDGFGLDVFKEALTGPEYAERYVRRVAELEIPVVLRSSAVNLSPDRIVTVWSPQGVFRLHAGAVVLSMGCRERTRGALKIPGTRPAGIYTAGVAQYLVNVLDYMVGERVVVLGSGDIGLIMARRLVLEGAEVVAVAEIRPYPSGLPRNIAQCVNEFDIPLLLKHTVVEVRGRRRLEGVVLAEVDESGRPVGGSERELPCDTLLLSVGLIPENELSRKAGVSLHPATGGPLVTEEGETSIPGIFACGNVTYVHDIVDLVSVEAERVGRAAVMSLREGGVGREGEPVRRVPVRCGGGIAYVVPQSVSVSRDLVLTVRPGAPGVEQRLVVRDRDRVVKSLRLRRVYPSQTISIAIRAQALGNPTELSVALEAGDLKGSGASRNPAPDARVGEADGS